MNDWKGTLCPMHRFRRLTAFLGCAFALAAAPLASVAQSIQADSATDFEPGVQGFGGWQYLYYRTGMSIAPFSRFNGASFRWEGPSEAYSSYLDTWGGRTSTPASFVDVNPIRRWTSPSSGWVVVRGDYAHAGSHLTSLYTGAAIHLRATATAAPSMVKDIHISHLDREVRSYAVLVKLARNNVLDFTLYPYENDNDDIARFTGVIDRNVAPTIYMPSPLPKNGVFNGYVKLPGAPTSLTGEMDYTLTSTNPTVLSVSGKRAVPVGGLYGDFSLVTHAVSAPTNVTIRAFFPLLNRTASVTVKIMP